MGALVLRSGLRTGDSAERLGRHVVGRAAELSALQTLLDGAKQGSGGAVVVSGDAGQGKSTVLDAATHRATAVQLLRCAGVETETELHYAGLHQLVWPLVKRVDALPDVQAAALRSAIGRGHASADRLLVGMALLTLLSEMAKEMPVLVVVEDAHHLDELTADALVFAARRLQSEPIAMLFAARTGSIRGFNAHGLPELALKPLKKDAAGELLDLLDADMAPLVKQRLIAESEGNPLAIIELCEALSSDERRGRDRLPLRLPLTDYLLQLHRQRLESLPKATQHLVLIVAAEPAGDTAVVRAAAQAMEISIDALSPAEQSRLVSADDRRIRFHHVLERSAVYRGASFGERVAAHQALAAVLPDDDRRAWHLAAAAAGQEEELAAALERSAGQAQARRGPAVAAAAWERAAELSTSDANRSRRLARAARAALDAGHFNRAQALLHDAERMRPGREVQADIELARGLAQYQTGALEDGPATLIHAAANVAHTSAERAALLLATAARVAWLTDDRVLLDEARNRIAELPLADGAPMKVVALSCAGPTMHTSVDLPGGIFGAALALSDKQSPAFSVWPPVAAADMAGELVAAQRLYRKLVVSLSTNGVVGQLTMAWTSLAMAELLLGRWNDASMHASEALRMREMGDVTSTGWALVVLSRIAAGQGRADESRSLAAEAIRLASDQGAHGIVSFAAWSAGSLELSLGRYEEAFAHFASAARPEAWPAGSLFAPRMAADLVEACIQTDRLEIANRVTEAMERWIEGPAPRWAHVAAHRCRALLSSGERAAAEFEAAVSMSGENNHEFEPAQTRLQYGEWLRRQRFKTEARRHLRTALETFTDLGAQPWVERAQAELRAAGVSVVSRSDMSIKQLTAQELQIARLGAQGMSNRDIGARMFLSPRTVGFHLSHVFGKLGIASRGELRVIDLGPNA